MSDLWGLTPDALSTLRPSDFPVTLEIPTRWRDNDSYGHVNNAVYYEYFDTAINSWLLDELRDSSSRSITRKFVAESRCRFLKELAYPDPITVSTTVHRLGRSSVTYDLAIFDSDTTLCALGRWVHVFVHTTTRRPVPIPDDFRDVFAAAARPLEEERTA